MDAVNKMWEIRFWIFGIKVWSH